MSERGEEYARKIEQNVREAVERMVADIRSSLEDVREAVVQQLDAASQSVQADAKSLSVRAHIDSILDEIQEPPPPPAAVPQADSGKLRRAVRTVEQGKSQVEVLNALLEQATHFASRAALFILKAETFAGWKGSGFSAHGGNDESVKRFSASGNDVPDLGSMLQDERVVATGSEIAARLGASAPADALLVPMVIKDKVAAAIYVDTVPGEEQQLDRAALELLVFTTGLLIDTLAIRKKIPSPTLSAADDEPTIIGAPPAPSPAKRPVAEPAPPPTAGPRPMVMPQVPPEPPRRPAPPPPPPRPEPPRTEQARQPAKPVSFQLETEEPTPRASSDFATTAIPSPVAPPVMPPPVAPPPVTPPSRPPAEKGAAAPHHEPAEKPSTQYIPPPGVAGSRFGSQQAQTPETKKHDEAKRFARLLVSEIKLYNEAKVDEGRKNRDIYDRLREDIDRSREMYDGRFKELGHSSNYFYDELVRILADGNPDLLGL